MFEKVLINLLFIRLIYYEYINNEHLSDIFVKI